MKSLLRESLEMEKFESDLRKRKDCDDDTKKYEYLDTNDEKEKRKTESRKKENFNANSTSTVPCDRGFESKYETKSSIFLVRSVQKQKIIKRSRRNSDCPTRIAKKVPKVRRKSCDFSYSFHEPVSHRLDSSDTVVFNQVESQLEKMFAGIIEGEANVIKPTGTITENYVDSNKQYKMNNTTNRKDVIFVNNSSNMPSNIFTNMDKNVLVGIQLNKKKNNSSKKYLHALSGNTISNRKKKISYTKSLKKGNNKAKNKVNHSHDTFTEIYNSNQAKYKGPIIQMRNFDDSTMGIEIINAPREEDEEKNKEKRRLLNSGILGKSKGMNRHQNNIDYRGSYRSSELFISTLSSRYDAHTTDATWFCVFCKKGPHYLIQPSTTFLDSLSVPSSGTVSVHVLSDLFGPFSIFKSTTEDNPVFACNNARQELPNREKQPNKRKCNTRYPMLIGHLFKSKKKKKLSSEEKKGSRADNSISSILNECCEIWMHEQCMIWCIGVYLAGGRINGLQDAVRESMVSVCSFCGVTGANITCLNKSCNCVVHYCCAVYSGWLLNTNEYISKCDIHKH